MSEPFQLTGYITRVEQMYVFVHTDRGEVYAPSAALRERYGDRMNYMDHFKQNENVQMMVTKQANPKNGCKWIAKSIKKVKSAKTPITEEVHGPMIATVTSVNETFGFAVSSKGTVFLPGQAFDPKYVQKINKYLKVDDKVIVHIKEQYERSGCRWAAVSAVKDLELTEEEKEEETQQSEIPKKYITGFGVVLDVQPMEVEIFDINNSRSVHASLLTYTGGFRGNASAKTLVDVIKKDEMIMYKAEPFNGQFYTAVEWKPIVYTDDFQIPKKVNTAESFTQCATDLVYTMFRRFLTENPDEIDRIAPVIDKFPDAALPDSYVFQRNDHSFSGI